MSAYAENMGEVSGKSSNVKLSRKYERFGDITGYLTADELN